MMNINENTCLWDELKSSKKPILLFGMGDGAQKVMKVLSLYHIKVSGVFCSDDFHKEKYFEGFKVLTYERAKQIFPNMIVLMCFGSNKDDVFEIVKTIEKEQEFFVPCVPVFGQGVFNKEFYKEHKEEMNLVYNRLGDDSSKKAYENVINYMLSGKTKYLFDCETTVEESYENIIKPTHNETYLDLGAYNGDTALEFLSYTNGKYGNMVLVEPDAKNYNKLKNNTKHLSNVVYFNGAIHKFDGEGEFNALGGRNSTVLTKEHKDKEAKTISVATVDKLCPHATFINMDVEGNEENAIIGAKNTIEKAKPKMLIAAYHRNEDIFAIPKQVLAINGEYKLYLRHFKYLPAWDTNFYFV